MPQTAAIAAEKRAWSACEKTTGRRLERNTRYRRAELSSSCAPTPRIDASRISTGWSAGSRASALPQVGRHLDEAARVRAGVRVGAGRRDVRRLPLAELRGGLGLDEVVDPGAPAADRLLGRLDELEARDRAEQRARRVADPLRVAEVAGVLVGDPQRELVPLGARLELGEQLVDVDHADRQVGVLQVRAAAGGVDDDRVARP